MCAFDRCPWRCPVPVRAPLTQKPGVSVYHRKGRSAIRKSTEFHTGERLRRNTEKARIKYGGGTGTAGRRCSIACCSICGSTRAGRGVAVGVRGRHQGTGIPGAGCRASSPEPLRFSSAMCPVSGAHYCPHRPPQKRPRSKLHLANVPLVCGNPRYLLHFSSRLPCSRPGFCQ
jgi:hypothetical protein